jgi:hypothetical protein
VKVFDGLGATIRGDVLLVLWQAPSRRPRVQWASNQIGEAIKQNPDGIVVVHLILPTSSPPDKEARAEARMAFERHQKKTRQTITVPLGDAFWTNVVRSIMRGLLLVTGQSAVHQVAASVADAIDRVRASASARTPPAAELTNAVRELFDALGEPPWVARPSATSSAAP